MSMSTDQLVTWEIVDYVQWIKSGCPVDSSVSVLDLKENNLLSISSELENLVNLEILDLSHNRLTSIPEEIGNLANLHTLDLSYNRLTSIPSLGNLDKLEILYLFTNQLTSLPDLLGKQIKMLYLDENLFTTIPSVVWSLHNIESLYLTHNRLTNIPDGIGELHSIQVLCLAHNRISTVSSELVKCHKLKDISIESNSLTSIPEEIGELTLLERLDISSNNLTTLPDSIGNLRQLQALRLLNNQITSIPQSIGNLINLHVLNVSVNRLTAIPTSIGNLQELRIFNVVRNLITTLPAEMGNLRNTIVMGMFVYSNNPIEYIPPNVLRLLNEQRHAQGVYNDSQSVHNSEVQKSIKASIMRLLTIPPAFNYEAVLASILTDLTLTDFTKQSLVEYSRNVDLISDVNVNFLEVLTAVWNRIVSSEHATDIKSVLNDEMADAECKCFTGRVSRLVNCLSGVDELVEVKISDNERIGNVIAVIGDRLTAEGRYSTSLHKEVARAELNDLGYAEEVVGVWLDYIE